MNTIEYLNQSKHYMVCRNLVQIDTLVHRIGIALSDQEVDWQGIAGEANRIKNLAGDVVNLAIDITDRKGQP